MYFWSGSARSVRQLPVVSGVYPNFRFPTSGLEVVCLTACIHVLYGPTTPHEVTAYRSIQCSIFHHRREIIIRPVLIPLQSLVVGARLSMAAVLKLLFHFIQILLESVENWKIGRKLHKIRRLTFYIWQFYSRTGPTAPFPYFFIRKLG